MTQRVVCAVDNSPAADHVVAYAAETADRLGLDLTLVHVAQDGPHASGNRAAVERGRHGAWEAAQGLFHRLRVDNGLGREAPGEVLFGSPVDQLERISKEPDVALIVVGSRGHGALRAAMTGSVSHALASRAACPVTVVPPTASERIVGAGAVA
jgi:nucleotide-binding universal stress UspA family protein